MKKVLFVATAILAFSGCKKDDDTTGGTNNTPSALETKIMSHLYTNERIIIDNQDETENILRECDLDNDQKFISEGRITQIDNGMVCSNNPNGQGSSWNTNPGTWKMLPGGTKMVYYTDTCIISLSATQLKLTSHDDPDSYTTLDIK